MPKPGVRVLLAGILAVGLASCADDDAADVTTTPASSAPSAPSGPSAPSTAATDTTAAATPPTSGPASTEPDTTPPAPAGWTRIVPGGDCQCATGGEFAFWDHRGDPSKVVLFFQGGGACFSADTCNPISGTYQPTVGPEDDPSTRGGIFDLTDERNPLADHSFVYVPYCTGDVHIGDATTEYAPGQVIHHVGAVNAAAALAHVAATYPDATEVLVTGESAGAVPTPLYAGELSDLLPDARITVLADGSGAYPDVPAINAAIGAVWGTLNAVPDWPENADVTAETWSFPGLFVRAGRHDPTITFARHDYAYDATQATFAALAGIPADDLLTAIDGNEQQIEAAGVDLLSYISPGTDHTVLGTDSFYTEVLEGVPLRDWVADLVAGEPVTDVHCVDCQRP